MRIWIWCLLVAVTGCTSSDFLFASSDYRPVTCANRAECDRYWRRAQQWIAENSAYPIRQMTDWVIQTPSPRDVGVHPSFTVIKTPTAEGGATIVLEVTCAVYLPCIPSRGSSIERFNGFIAAPSSPAAAPQ